MNMKNLLAASVVAALVATAVLVTRSDGQSGAPKQPSIVGGVGRYQLVTGRVIHDDLNTLNNMTISKEEPVMMKIDTVTGETWILQPRSSGPGMIVGDPRNHMFFTPDGWLPVKDCDFKPPLDMGPIPSPGK